MTVLWLILALIALLAALYIWLYRIVAQRQLPDEIVLFGFSPLLIVPALLYARAQKPRSPPADFNGVVISALDNKPLIWCLAIFGAVIPLVMNVVAWLSLRWAVPRRLDAQGVQMRSGKQYYWVDCQSGSSPWQSNYDLTGQDPYLSLWFPNGVVHIQTKTYRETPAFSYAMRMVERLHIPLD